MTSKSPFAGLEILAPGDPLSSDGYFFQARNPQIIDLLLKIGAVTHRHDEHPGVADPTRAPTVSTSTTGGAIPANTPIYVTYTLTDVDGGETLPVEAVVLTTQLGYGDPTGAPDAAVDYTAGGLLSGDYSYAITVTDGRGGETMIGPEADAWIDPGHVSARVHLSGLAAIVADAAAGLSAGWRLWRAQGGGPWYLLASGTADTFTDDGVIGDCTITPPLSGGTTASTNTLTVTVPSGQPAGASLFSIYASLDGSFTGPSLLGTYPIAQAGLNKTFTDLTTTDGTPPVASLSLPGAHQIWPDTELRFGMKTGVAAFEDLPTSGNENFDMRFIEASKAVVVYYNGEWLNLGGTWLPPVDRATSLPPYTQPGLLDGSVAVTIDTGHLWEFMARAREANDFVDVQALAPTSPDQTIPFQGAVLKAVDDTYLYFSWWDTREPGFVSTTGRAKLDGSEVEMELVTGQNMAAVDSEYIYFTVAVPSTIPRAGWVIGRANKDGTGLDAEWLNPNPGAGQGFIRADSIVATDTYIYVGCLGIPGPPFYDPEQTTIYRFEKDGSNPTRLYSNTPVNNGVRTGNDSPGIAVDATHIYYTFINGGLIGRMDLDGSNQNDSWLVVGDGGSGQPTGPIVSVPDDPDGPMLYFGMAYPARIARTPTNWPSPNYNYPSPNYNYRQLVASADGVNGLAWQDGYLYWSTFGLHTLGSTHPIPGRWYDRSAVDMEGPGAPYLVWVPGTPDAMSNSGHFADAGGGASTSLASGVLSTADHTQTEWVLGPITGPPSLRLQLTDGEGYEGSTAAQFHFRGWADAGFAAGDSGSPPAVAPETQISTTVKDINGNPIVLGPGDAGAELDILGVPGSSGPAPNWHIYCTSFYWTGTQWKPEYVANATGTGYGPGDAFNTIGAWTDVRNFKRALPSKPYVYATQWTGAGAIGVNTKVRVHWTDTAQLFTGAHQASFWWEMIGVALALGDGTHGLVYYLGAWGGWTFRPKDLLLAEGNWTPTSTTDPNWNDSNPGMRKFVNGPVTILPNPNYDQANDGYFGTWPLYVGDDPGQPYWRDDTWLDIWTDGAYAYCEVWAKDPDLGVNSVYISRLNLAAAGYGGALTGYPGIVANYLKEGTGVGGFQVVVGTQEDHWAFPGTGQLKFSGQVFLSQRDLSGSSLTRQPDGTGLGAVTDIAVGAVQPSVRPGGDHTLAFDDLGHVIEMDGGTLTIPAVSDVTPWPLGAAFELLQLGTTAADVAGGSGVTLVGTTTTPGQYTQVRYRQRNYNEWVGVQ